MDTCISKGTKLSSEHSLETFVRLFFYIDTFSKAPIIGTIMDQVGPLKDLRGPLSDL